MTYATLLARHRHRSRELRNALLGLFATAALGLAYVAAVAVQTAQAKTAPQTQASK